MCDKKKPRSCDKLSTSVGLVVNLAGCIINTVDVFDNAKTTDQAKIASIVRVTKQAVETGSYIAKLSLEDPAFKCHKYEHKSK